MKLCNLDRHPDYPSQGVGPLGLCLQWLDTLTKSPAVNWNPQQLAQAKANLRDAWELMFSDALTLAGVASVERDQLPASPAEGFYDARGILRNLSLAPGLLGLAPADEAAGCTIRAVAVQPLRQLKPAPKTREEVMQAIDQAEAQTAAAIAREGWPERDEADDLEARAVANLGRRCGPLDRCQQHGGGDHEQSR